MRCIIDTNILFSAALFPGKKAHQAFRKAILDPIEAFVCDYCVDELRRVFSLKYPDKLVVLERFIEYSLVDIKILETTDTSNCPEVAKIIRDPKDVPIMSAAIKNDIDIIITGDKDFVVLGLEKPKTVSPTEVLENY